MRLNGGIRHHQCRSGCLPGRLQSSIRFIRKRDDWQMKSRSRRAKLPDDRADIRAFGSEVHQYQHRTRLRRHLGQLPGICHYLHAIAKVRQPVHQKRSGHQVFVTQQGQRQNHAANLGAEKIELQKKSGMAISQAPSLGLPTLAFRLAMLQLAGQQMYA